MDDARLATFLAKLDPRQAAVARGMLDDGWKITTFWGPEQMDVWRLVLTWRDLEATFGMGRGFSDGIQLADPRMPTPTPRRPSPPLEFAWVVWARRTGVLATTPDPRAAWEIADLAAWRSVCTWLAESAEDADVAAIEALWEVYLHHAALEHGRERRVLTAEERAADAEAAVAAGSSVIE